METILHQDWIAEGEKRFGKNPCDWKFVCGKCGNIQYNNKHTASTFLEIAYLKCQNHHCHTESKDCDTSYIVLRQDNEKTIAFKFLEEHTN